MGTTTTPAAELQGGPTLSKEGYRTAPDHETTAWPPGVPYIVGNEACERFSFYGMRAILSAHLVTLFAAAGNERPLAEGLANSTTHLFFAAVYALPMIGAIIADRLAGKYRTIFYLSLVYCVGQAVLAFGESDLSSVYWGLALIAIGSGGIKPCVSANVGDQFGKGNWFRVRTVYQMFYFSINLGSFFATLSIPWTKAHSGEFLMGLFPSALAGVDPNRLGTAIAFGIPGVLMFVATVIFWMGRRKFVHVPPRPGGLLGLLDTLSSVSLFLAVGHLFFSLGQPWAVQLGLTALFLVLGLALFAWRQRLAPENGFLAIMLYTLRQFSAGTGRPAVRQGDGTESALARSRFWGPAVDRFGLTAAEGPVAVLKLVSIFVFVSAFWALFDQKATTWVRQTERMDLTLWGDHKILATQVQAFNPLLVMAFIPLMNVLYGVLVRRGIRTTTLRRMTVGMFLASLAFVCVALIEREIVHEGVGKVWFLWQLVPYVIITAAEILVSTTGLEFAYTQAPKAMKSTVMGFWLLAVTLGNVLVALVARLGKYTPLETFWLWAGVVGVAAVLFALRSYFYVPKDYPQE
jgi:POT family proton-dependent oligopeptide transporter